VNKSKLNQTPSKISKNSCSLQSQSTESTLLTPVKLNPTQTNTIRYLDEKSGVEYDIITVPKQQSQALLVTSTPQKPEDNFTAKSSSKSRNSELDPSFRSWSEAEHAALEKLVSLHGHDWEQVAGNLLVS